MRKMGQKQTNKTTKQQAESHLVVDSSLQLHDLVLHSFVEFFEVLHRAGFDLQLLQLAPGPHPADATLQVHDGLEGALVPAASQPATNVLLKDQHLVLAQQLERRRRRAEHQHKDTAGPAHVLRSLIPPGTSGGPGKL